ncbi:PfkB family carbohydrate kinase [Nordella sp. HKS 07]|uniref:PfkB family carbohydrate kinase n=1 Tax=Nordella sp. HKS 07 TaxID=2712222 RepID=UPI002110CCB7|nr:PfkB family carbohydrate kinase [Nordella sp. HKS 07]
MVDHFDVAVVGSLHLDIMTKSPRLPALDETVLGQSWHFKCGGKGGNQAVAAARAGARTAFVGCVGNDDFGSRLLANLDAAQVDRSRVSIVPMAGSGMSVAMEDASGNYSAVVVSGANQSIQPSQYENLSVRVLLIQNEISSLVTLDAARACKRDNTFVIYNTAPFLPLSDELLHNVDLIVANRVEATDATGIAIASLSDAARAAQALSSYGCNSVVTAGNLGCALCAHRGKPDLIAAVKVKPVSTHGAGDFFCGVVAARIAQGVELADAVSEANISAARFVSCADGVS